MLDHFRPAVLEFIFGQGLKVSRVYKDKLGEMEGADKILAAGQVAAGLAAGGGVHHGKQRGGKIDPVDAAHPGRGGKSRQVAGHAASESGQGILASQAVGEDVFPDLFHGGKSFELFPALDGLICRVGESGGIGLGGIFIGDDQIGETLERSEIISHHHQGILEEKFLGDSPREGSVVGFAFLGFVAKGTGAGLGGEASVQLFRRRSLQTPDAAFFFRQLAVGVVKERAAAQGDNGALAVRPLDERSQSLALGFAEGRFAARFEDLGNAFSFGLGDLGVQVEEGTPQCLG